MVIENNTILYFSGTGNSFQIAKDIKDELGDIHILNIALLMNEEEIIVKSKMLGIVFPVYYYSPPLIVKSMAKRLKIDKHTYVFAAATHGATPSDVLVKFNNILKTNGNMLNSGFLIQMPGNYIFNYGAFPKWLQNKLFIKEKKKIKKISMIIKERKNQKCEISKIKIDVLVDRILAKSTNNIISNFHMSDSNFWVNENCNSCRLCEKICPVNNIEFTQLNKPAWKHKCEQCTACIQFCPNEAIQWGSKTAKRKRYRNPNVTLAELIHKKD